MKLSQRPLVFIDIETTGLDPTVHEMVEFAAKRISCRGVELDETEFRVKPLHPETAQPEALKLNGYDPEKWQNALDPESALRRIVDFCCGDQAIIVGQNPGFDLGFINAMIKQYGAKDKIPYHKVDTVSLAYTILVPLGLERLSLKNICEFLGISNAGEHGAMRDVERCVEVYYKLTKATWFDKWQWKRKNAKRG